MQHIHLMQGIFEYVLVCQLRVRRNGVTRIILEKNHKPKNNKHKHFEILSVNVCHSQKEIK